jgi:hypothetical protein
VAVRLADDAAVVPLRAVTLDGWAMLTYSWIVSSWLGGNRGPEPPGRAGRARKAPDCSGRSARNRSPRRRAEERRKALLGSGHVEARDPEALQA